MDPGHVQPVGLVQGSPEGRVRGDRAEQLSQVPQCLEIPDRLTAGQLDQAQVGGLQPGAYAVVERIAEAADAAFLVLRPLADTGVPTHLPGRHVLMPVDLPS